MPDEVMKAKIGHGEIAVISPKGFWPGQYDVTISLFDEPGNRKMVVVFAGRKIEQALAVPAQLGILDWDDT